MKQADKRPAIVTVLKYGLYCFLSFVAFRLFSLIPGSSPLKYVASVITVVAVIHSVWSERRKAKEKKEDYSIPADKWFLFFGLLVAFGAAINDDVKKYATDQASQKKSDKLAKAQTDLALTNNKLALTTNENTHKAAADAAKARAYAAQTRTDATRIRQDDAVIVLSQKVLTALAHQNNKMARQNALEQERAIQQQLRDSKLSRSVTEEQSARTREENQRLALHTDVAEASRSVHSLRQTLYGLERTLSPIQDVRMTCLFVVPLDRPDPQIQAYRASLNKAVAQYEAASPAGKASLPFTEQGGPYTTLGGVAASNERLTITRGSELYPTDVTKLPGSLFSHPIKVGFWKRIMQKTLQSRQIAMQTSLPDMQLEVTSNDYPQLWYYPADKALVLGYYNVPVGIAKNSGNIISLPDLSGALVQVGRLNYDFTKAAFTQPGPTTSSSFLPIWRISFQMSNRFYVFDASDFRYSLDSHLELVTSFTFDSKRAAQHNGELSIGW